MLAVRQAAQALEIGDVFMLRRLPGAVADQIWGMIELCDVRAADGTYRRQDPWALLARLQSPGSPLAEHPDSKACTRSMAMGTNQQGRIECC